MFSNTVQEHIRYYVYRLIDPRDSSTFYVGKGHGNRVFDHIKAIMNGQNLHSSKNNKLKDIISSGLTPEYIIHRHGMDELTALEVEGALIDAYPNLLNENEGHHNSERGSMSWEEIIFNYDLPEIPKPDFPVLVVNINNITDQFDRKSVYQQVQGNWVVSPVNAEKMKYVIAAYKGVAVGIFKPEKWLPSKQARRYLFKGSEASPEVWDKYVGKAGKRIADPRMRNTQNPIRYYYP